MQSENINEPWSPEDNNISNYTQSESPSWWKWKITAGYSKLRIDIRGLDYKQQLNVHQRRGGYHGDIKI